MGNISYDSAKKLANCLSGNPPTPPGKNPYSDAPAGFQTGENWVDGLLSTASVGNPAKKQNKVLLTSAPCNIDTATYPSDVGTITAAIATIKNTTYTSSDGKSTPPFWELVAKAFATDGGVLLHEEKEASPRDARSLIIAAVELARKHPDMSAEEIAATHGPTLIAEHYLTGASY